METTKQSNKKDKKTFWKRNFLALFLLILMIIGGTWGFLSYKISINRYKNTITELKAKQQEELDSIKVANVKDISNTLALAVRSEMINENMHQINQYFIQTVKMLDVRRVVLANPTDGTILLSTDKKDNNTVFKNQKLIQAQKAIIDIVNGSKYVATPIMGLNSQLGTLIIQVN